MFRAPAMLLPHESTVAHEQNFAAELPEPYDLEEERKQKVSYFHIYLFSGTITLCAHFFIN